MRLLTALLVFAFALPASGQGLSRTAPGQSGATKFLIPDTAETVAHIYWTGLGFVDTKSVAWAQQGTVPITASALFKTKRYGSGAYSATNHYTLPAGNAVDFAGDFTACFIYNHAAGSEGVIDTGNNSTTGWNLYISATTATFGMPGWNGGTETTATSNSTVGAVNITCVGVNGASFYITTNLVAGPTRTPTAPYTVGGGTAYLGRYSSAGLSFDGTIYEAWFSSKPFVAAEVLAIQQKVLAQRK